MSVQKVKIYDETADVKLVAPNLWEVDQCFSKETLAWLQSIYETEGNEFVAVGLKKRLQLKFGSEDFAKLNQIGVDILPMVSTIIGTPVELAEVKYWIDLPQFGCQSHSDAEELYCAFQIYLYSSNQRVKDFTSTEITHFELLAEGAEFTHVDPPYQILFKPNHGYINLNSDLKPHWVPGRWDTRISVIFQFRRV